MCDNADTLWDSNRFNPQWKLVDVHFTKQAFYCTLSRALYVSPDTTRIEAMFSPDTVQSDQMLLFDIRISEVERVVAPALQTIAVDFVPRGTYECLSQIQITFCVMYSLVHDVISTWLWSDV